VRSRSLVDVTKDMQSTIFQIIQSGRKRLAPSIFPFRCLVECPTRRRMGYENLGIVGYPTIYYWRAVTIRQDVWRMNKHTLGLCHRFVLKGTLDMEWGRLE
jgi:hypothetical protein